MLLEEFIQDLGAIYLEHGNIQVVNIIGIAHNGQITVAHIPVKVKVSTADRAVVCTAVVQAKINQGNMLLSSPATQITVAPLEI